MPALALKRWLDATVDKEREPGAVGSSSPCQLIHGGFTIICEYLNLMGGPQLLLLQTR